MDLEEIKCQLCSQQFSMKARVPLLLPDCGHSYCEQCIEENSNELGFTKERRRMVLTDAENEN